MAETETYDHPLVMLILMSTPWACYRWKQVGAKLTQPPRQAPEFPVPTGWSAKPEHLESAKKNFPKTAYGIDASFPVNPILSDRSPDCAYLVECPQGKKVYYI